MFYSITCFVFFTISSYFFSENISAEWLKLRFKYLALTPDVIHLLETLRYDLNVFWFVLYYAEIFSRAFPNYSPFEAG